MLPPSTGQLGCPECGFSAMAVGDFVVHVKLLHLGLDVWAKLDPK
jgi:hypothetical protein